MEIIKKGRRRSTFIEFLKTRKIFKTIEEKYVEDKYWSLEILLTNGTKTNLTTTRPDSNEYQGLNGFDTFLEWFMRSDNPYFKFRYDKGYSIWVRNKILLVKIIEIVKERRIS